MALTYQYDRENGFGFITYNGYPFYRSLEEQLKQAGADQEEIAGGLIEAFETIAADTIFDPIKYLIDNDKAPWFSLTILSVLAPIPEVLGAATGGYIFDPKDRNARKRHNLGMSDYILRGYSKEDRSNWTRLHWKNVRNALAHSITANYVWLEDAGGLHQVNRINSEMFVAHIDVVRWQDEFKSGFYRFVRKVENRNNRELRRNFRRYITQQEAE